MKIFISWSGDRSRALAEVVRRWLPSVVQAVRPYFSPDDVAKGSRWSSEIAKELEASRMGLLVLTRENQEAPWLLFEAGALAKNLERSKVCPLLFGGLEPTDVTGPLVQFQAAQFSEEEVKRVVKMINAELGEAALSGDVLDGVFDMWWPKLEEQVGEILETEDEDDSEGGGRRSDRDLLEEVVALTRGFARDRERKADFDHPAWNDLFKSVAGIIRAARTHMPHEDVVTSLRPILPALDYIVHRELRGARVTRPAKRLLLEIAELTSDTKGRLVASAEADESEE